MDEIEFEITFESQTEPVTSGRPSDDMWPMDMLDLEDQSEAPAAPHESRDLPAFDLSRPPTPTDTPTLQPAPRDVLTPPPSPPASPTFLPFRKTTQQELPSFPEDLFHKRPTPTPHSPQPASTPAQRKRARSPSPLPTPDDAPNELGDFDEVEMERPTSPDPREQVDAVMHEPRASFELGGQPAPEVVDEDNAVGSLQDLEDAVFETIEYSSDLDEQAERETVERASEVLREAAAAQLADQTFEPDISVNGPSTTTVARSAAPFRTSAPKLLETLSGDINVLAPASAKGWDFVLDETPADRLSHSFAKSLKSDTRMFFLPPPNPPASSSDLPLFVLQARLEVFAVALTRKTMMAYGGHVLRLLKYCEDINLPNEQRFPLTSSQLLGHLAVLASDDGLRLGTIEHHISGLKWWHAAHGVPFPKLQPQWGYMAKGITQIQPNSDPEREPIVRDDLRAIRAALDLDDPMHAAFWAGFLVAYYGMLRNAEWTIEGVTKFDLKLHATRANLKIVRATDSCPTHVVLHLPWCKEKKEKGRDVYIFPQGQDPDLNPLSALANHLRINDPPSTTSLFSYRENSDRNKYRPLTQSWARKFSQSLLENAGRQIKSIYGLRSGGATFYMMSGSNPLTVMRAAGWKSLAFMRYWRNVRIIAAQALADRHLRDEFGTEEPLAQDQLALLENALPGAKRRKKAHGGEDEAEDVEMESNELAEEDETGG